MEEFFEWLRNRFVLAELMHLADIESETLKTMIIQNGPSRDAFIKFVLYKFLLDIDSYSDDSKEHNLENIFVTFGILDKEVAQKFLSGDMSINLHIATWKNIIGVLIPATTIASRLPSYDKMMKNIFDKYNNFKSVESKNFLPPELIPKCKVQPKGKHENSDSIEEISVKLMNIMKKQNKIDDGQIITNSAERFASNHINLEFMDLMSVNNEIDQYVKISSENKINLPSNKQSSEMITQEMAKLANKQNMIQSECFESKVKNICKLVKAENDVEILVSSLADKVLN